MNFIEILKAIFSALSGGAQKEEEAKTEEKPQSAQEQPAAETSNPNNVEGTQMRKSVFKVMTAGEKDASQIESIKSQMRYKDALGSYPYTITSDNWIYKITKPPEPEFSQYGTQYSAAQKHK